MQQSLLKQASLSTLDIVVWLLLALVLIALNSDSVIRILTYFVFFSVLGISNRPLCLIFMDLIGCYVCR